MRHKGRRNPNFVCKHVGQCPKCTLANVSPSKKKGTRGQLLGCQAQDNKLFENKYNDYICELFVEEQHPLKAIVGQIVIVRGKRVAVAEVISKAEYHTKCQISAHPLDRDGSVLTRSYIAPMPLGNWSHVEPGK